MRAVIATDGRTPLQVFEEHRLIPNSIHAPCSFELKIKPFEAWLWRVPKPTTILIGLSWAEPHRINRLRHYHKHNGRWRPPQGFARRIPGVYEDFPLMWRPLEYRPANEVVRSWGIEPPDMYNYGFPHANCGGRCIKQGISEWKRLWLVKRARFIEMRDWEAAQRAKGGARATATICQRQRNGVTYNITLAELEQEWLQEQCSILPLLRATEDRSSCYCTEA